MKVFASSDHHFFHKNIIKYANRPFDIHDENCVRKNAKLMIERHNEIVSDDDYVLIVGDLSASLRKQHDLFKQIINVLNGKKILIRGNHDHLPNEFYIDAGFKSVKDYMQIDNFFICHYPCYKTKWCKGAEPALISKLKKTNCTNIIHGHIHNKNPETYNDNYYRTNVCVDYKPNDFYPVELKEQSIIDYFSRYDGNDF